MLATLFPLVFVNYGDRRSSCPPVRCKCGLTFISRGNGSLVRKVRANLKEGNGPTLERGSCSCGLMRPSSGSSFAKPSYVCIRDESKLFALTVFSTL